MARTRPHETKPVERRSAPAATSSSSPSGPSNFALLFGAQEERRAHNARSRSNSRDGSASASNTRGDGGKCSDSDSDYASTTEEEESTDDEDDDETAPAAPAKAAAPVKPVKAAAVRYTGKATVTTAVVMSEAEPTDVGDACAFNCLCGYDVLVKKGTSAAAIADWLAEHVPPHRARDLAQSMVDCMAEPGKELVFGLVDVPPAVKLYADGQPIEEVVMLSLCGEVRVDFGPDDDDDDADDGGEDDGDEQALYRRCYHALVEVNVLDDWFDGVVYWKDDEALDALKKLTTRSDFNKILAASKIAN